MSDHLWDGIYLIVGGIVLLWIWWLEMFSDSWVADLCRGMADGGGKNMVALFEPAGGVVALTCGGMIFLENMGWDYESLPVMLLGCLMLLSLMVCGFSLIPIPLPAPMYPEWQKERRRLLAEGRAEREVWAAPAGRRSRWGLRQGRHVRGVQYDVESSPSQAYRGRHVRGADREMAGPPVYQGRHVRTPGRYPDVAPVPVDEDHAPPAGTR